MIYEGLESLTSLTNDYYLTAEEFIDARIKLLKDAPDDYLDFIPRWHKQKDYVEVWSEKDAMIGTFRSILKGKDVGVLPDRGFTSWTALADFRERLINNAILVRKKAHILYFGDFDPSGEKMVSDLIKRLDKIPLNKRKDKFKEPQKRRPSLLDVIEFKHIAVTKEQVRKFHLPSEIDEATLKKMQGHYRPDNLQMLSVKVLASSRYLLSIFCI